MASIFSLSDQAAMIFLFLDFIIGGGAAFLAGRALAMKWRPLSLVFLYTIPLAAAVRFFHYALFQQVLFSFSLFVLSYALLLAFALLGYRLRLVSQMVRQYSWLYVRSTPLTWMSKK